MLIWLKKRLENYKNEITTAQEEISKHIVKKTFKQRKKEGKFVGKHKKENSRTPKNQTPSLF